MKFYAMGMKTNKSTTCGHQRSAVGCLIEDENQKKDIILKKKKKMHFELSPLIVWIVNTYSEFQANIFSNSRDITKCHSFCMTTMTTPRL